MLTFRLAYDEQAFVLDDERAVDDFGAVFVLFEFAGLAVGIAVDIELLSFFLGIFKVAGGDREVHFIGRLGAEVIGYGQGDDIVAVGERGKRRLFAAGAPVVSRISKMFKLPLPGGDAAVGIAGSTGIGRDLPAAGNMFRRNAEQALRGFVGRCRWRRRCRRLSLCHC